MSNGEEKSLGKGSETIGGDRDKMLRELESKLIALASTTQGTLPRKTVEEMEKVINEYYKGWKA